MKTLVLLAVAVISSVLVKAQPILTASTNTPISGQRFKGHVCDTTGITPQMGGTSVTWNYAALTQIGLDTTSYFNCLSSPYCDSFPTSNLVQFDMSTYLYLNATSSAISIIGQAVLPSPTYNYFTNPLDVIYFPLAYNSTHIDTGMAHGTSLGFTDYSTITDSFKCDGWGTLNLPGGLSFPNSLRLHVVAHTKDSVDFPGTPFVTLERTESYMWFASGFHHQLLEINLDTSGSMPLHVTGVKYFTNGSSLSVNTMTHNSDLSIYPNPTKDFISIAFEKFLDGDVSIRLFDIVGKEVKNTFTQLLKGANTLTLSVVDLPNGIYFLRVNSDGHSDVQKITVIK